MQLDLAAERHHADDGRRAAGRQHLERLLGRGLGAEALDGVMHAALRQLLDALARGRHPWD